MVGQQEQPAAKVSRAMLDHQDLLGTLVPLAQVVSRASQVHRDRKVLLVALDNQDSRVSSVRTVLLVSQEYVVTTAHLAVLDNRVPLAIVETKVCTLADMYVTLPVTGKKYPKCM